MTNPLQAGTRGNRPASNAKGGLADSGALDHLTANTVATVIAACADIALVIDSKGIIVDLSVSGSEIPPEVRDHWLTQPWHDTVAQECRPDVAALLRDAAGGKPMRWRHITQVTADGHDIPVRYCTVDLNDNGNILAVGRSLQMIADLQQRLVETQQSVQRDYRDLRQLEGRYRFLLQTASEAVLVVDAGSQKVLEANPVAENLMGERGKKIVGRPLADGFAQASKAAIRDFLAKVQAAGRAEDIPAGLPDDRRLVVRAALLRHESGSLLLVRLHVVNQAGADSSLSEARRQLASIVESAPDGIVVTGRDGRIASVNPAFLEMAQLSGEDEARGESLEQWLGRPGVDLNVLMANVSEHGSVRLFSTFTRGKYGTVTEVEISAVAIRSDDQLRFGFVIRDVGPRLARDNPTVKAVPRSAEQFKELVGRVPLKELVRECTAVIEKACIEAALELTNDNRASAAELLGLSRQSLYVKLRRYGLGDPGADPEA